MHDLFGSAEIFTMWQFRHVWIMQEWNFFSSVSFNHCVWDFWRRISSKNDFTKNNIYIFLNFQAKYLYVYMSWFKNYVHNISTWLYTLFLRQYEISQHILLRMFLCHKVEINVILINSIFYRISWFLQVHIYSKEFLQKF